jgi:ribosomal protein L37E
VITGIVDRGSSIPRAVFFRCYRCAEPTMSITAHGVYCRGCGLQAFTDHTEVRVTGVCGIGHGEMVRNSIGALRCLVCSSNGEYAQ